jgi:HAE1 family hydrophobic/amphiphilic exporter-1
VTRALREAVVLVVLILFLFLQDWKATLVPAIAIPVSLVGTFLFVKIFGFVLTSSPCSAWCWPRAWWWTMPSP